jgi:hypothetical protein
MPLMVGLWVCHECGTPNLSQNAPERCPVCSHDHCSCCSDSLEPTIDVIEHPEKDKSEESLANNVEIYEDETQSLQVPPDVTELPIPTDSTENSSEPLRGNHTLWHGNISDRVWDLSILGFISTWIRNYVLKYWRPRVPRGYKRLEWICDCGQSIYGDFDCSCEDSLNELAEILRCTENVESACQGSPQHRSDPGESTSSQTSYRTSSPFSRQPQLLYGRTQDTNRPLQPETALESTGTKIYLELCVNTGEFRRSLSEIDITYCNSDGELFALVRQEYNKLRGFRTRFFLLKTVDIHYVQVSLRFPYL